MTVRRIVVVGAAGQGREVEWLIRDLGSARYEFSGFVVSDLANVTERDSRARILGDYDWLMKNRAEFDALAIGIGTPAARLKVAADLEPAFDASWWPALMHPSNPLDRSSCVIGHGVLICAGSIATVGVTFEPFSMANFGCTIGHETTIGRGSVINPGANISGGVLIGEGVLVGTGAQVLQYLAIGAGATIGAGAVVTKAVPAGKTVAGVPAVPLRRNHE